jgi:alpha/beta superfamily hydrolase
MVVEQDNEFALSSVLVKPKNPTAAVLLLHGFASHKDEVGDFYKTLAEKLAQKNIASLRFDFACYQDSEQLTVTNMLAEAKAAFNYLSKTFPKLPIGLCGFSLGAAIIGLLMGEVEIKAEVSIVALLSPAITLINDFSFNHKAILEKLLYQSPLHNETVEYDLGWRKMYITPNFFRELFWLEKIIAKNWAAFTGKALIIGGENDFSGAHVLAFPAIAPHAKKIQQEFLKDTDHIFNIFTPHSQEKRVIETVVDWFNNQK